MIEPGGGDRRAVVAGLALAAVGTLILPLGDAIGKYLVSLDIHVFQVTWGRWAAHLIAMTPVVLWRFSPARLKVSRAWLHIVRAGLLVVATIAYFSALKIIPLADAAAILFVAPLIVTGLSGLVLKEKVDASRWLAVFMGFAGVVLIVRPGGAINLAGAGLAFIAALSFSVYFLLTRLLRGRNPAMVTLWFMGVVGAALMSPLALAVWQPLPVAAWAWIAAIGVVMAAGHLMLIVAMESVEASLLAPMPYLELVTATALGYIWFGDFPALSTWAGCGIVIAAGLFVTWRGRQTVGAGHAATRG